MIAFTDEQWSVIDAHIFSRNILMAIKTIREYADVGIREASDIHFERYKQLRSRAPERFTCSHEEYWRDVYS